MTNAQIIENQKQQLAAEGILKYTGRVYTVKMDDGNNVTIKEVEDIHTFAAWKALGYSVRKGEKARCQFTIWKKGKDKETEVDGKTVVISGRMFTKLSSFFTADQVEKG